MIQGNYRGDDDPQFLDEDGRKIAESAAFGNCVTAGVFDVLLRGHHSIRTEELVFLRKLVLQFLESLLGMRVGRGGNSNIIQSLIKKSI